MTVDELLEALEFKDRYPEHCSGKDMETILLMTRFVERVRDHYGDNLKDFAHRAQRESGGPTA